MSSQWEVVVKSKKKQAIKKPELVEKKKSNENGPKLEEILPTHQMKTIFSNLNKEKNKEKKPEKIKPVSPKSKSAEQVKKQNNPAPPPKPKNLEAALASISPSDLEVLVENLKVSFPGSQLLWLKGVSSFLNSNLHIETDPLFSGKSLQYPSNVIPKNLKNAITTILNSVDEVNLFYFFDQLLTGMAMDMSKNQPALGYKILLQLIAQGWPQVCASNLAKNAILRNSYQNRSSTGLSLLWALGQGGYKDTTVGIKVWQNIMAPIIELKSYSRFVCEYIEKILKISDSHSKISLTQEEFFAIYNALTSKYSSLPKDCQQMLIESSSMLTKKFIYSSSKLANLFLNLFRKIEHPQHNQVQITGCIECLIKNLDCFKIWKMNYKRNVLPSLILMKKLVNDWDKLPSTFKISENLKEFLIDINQLNKDLISSKKKDENVDDLVTATKNLQDKVLQKKKNVSKTSSSICPWIFGILVLLGAIGGLIAYDVNNHGGVFEKSTVGKILKDTGALPYVEVAWYKVMSNGARGYKWAEENLPVYYDNVSSAAKPYTNLACDLFKVLRNALVQIWEAIRDYVNEKTPVVVDFVDQYVPGLPKKIQDLSISAWSTSVNVYNNSCDFFRTKVFIGSFSPENLSKALNRTQIAAAKYYSWFHEKVDAYAKIK